VLHDFETNGQQVVVPLAFFERVLEVYYAAKSSRLVPAQEPSAPTLQSPATHRVGEGLVDLRDVEVLSRPVPPGYKAMGAAASVPPRPDPPDGDE
jgi:hypothetical protein